MPVTVEAPNVARVNERHEWEYGQMQHQAALKGARGMVDQSTPSCVDPQVQMVQTNTRRFNEDQKRAGIGRENRKLVEKLESISRGYGGSDPRAPPSKDGYAKTPGPFILNRSDGYKTSLSLSPSSSQKRNRSLNEAYRHKTQRRIDQDNASLVRRILAIGSTFDRKGEARDFDRHRRAVQNLQRYSDGRSSMQQPPRSLPPLRAPRPSSHLAVSLRGLESLFVPGDLQRSGTSPALFDADARMSTPPQEQLASTAPPEQFADEEAPAPSAGGAVAEERAPMAGDDAAAWGMDFATERRSWLQEDAIAAKQSDPVPNQADVQPSSSFGSRSKAQLGMSTDSEVPYSADWDENSMSGSSPMRLRAEGSGRGGLGSAGSFGGGSLGGRSTRKFGDTGF